MKVLTPEEWYSSCDIEGFFLRLPLGEKVSITATVICRPFLRGSETLQNRPLWDEDYPGLRQRGFGGGEIDNNGSLCCARAQTCYPCVS